LKTDKCLSVTGLYADTSQLSPNDIIQFLLDSALPVREMVKEINKMITLPIVEMTTMPSDDYLYKLATISDPDEVLFSDYVHEFLSKNAYRRWQNSGTILIFHRNAGAFVIDTSNKHFKDLEGSKKSNFRNLRLEKDRQGLLTRIGEVREYLLQSR
jgi:hypothetical protein